MLGVEQAGSFFLGMTILGLVSIVVRKGYENTIVKYIAAKSSDIREASMIGQVYLRAISTLLKLGLPIVAILLICAKFFSDHLFSVPDMYTVLVLVSISLIPYCVNVFSAKGMQGLGCSNWFIFYTSLCTPTVFLMLSAVFPINTASSAILLYVIAIFFSAITATTHFYWNKPHSKTKLGLSDSENRQISTVASRLFVVQLCAGVTQWACPLALGVVYSTSDVAIFSVSTRIAMLISFLLVAINAVVASKISVAYKVGDIDEIKHISKKSSLFLFSTATPIFFLICIYPDHVLSLFGEGFTSGKNCLIILAAGQYINVSTGSVGVMLQMTNGEDYLRLNSIISALIALIGSLILVPVLGLIGGAISLALAWSTQNLLGVFFVNKLLGFNTLVFWR